MALDFTALQQIGINRDFKVLEALDEQNPQPTEKPQETQSNNNIADRKITEQQQVLENARQVYAAHQDAIKKTEQLQAQILKGIKKGVSSYDLLLMAVEAVSLATSNSVFYSQAKADLIAIYGEALNEERPLEWKLEATLERLKNLKVYQAKEEGTTDDKGRVTWAIKSHEEEAERIQKKLSKG